MSDMVPRGPTSVGRTPEVEGAVLVQDFRLATLARLAGVGLGIVVILVDSITGSHLGWWSVVVAGLLGIEGQLAGEVIEKGILIKPK